MGSAFLKSEIVTIGQEPKSFSIIYYPDKIRLKPLKTPEEITAAGSNWVTLSKPGNFVFFGTALENTKCACLDEANRKLRRKLKLELA